MTIKEKIKLFQRFLKELGLCKIYIQDNKICKRDNLRKTIEHLYIFAEHDVPSEVINHSLLWADTEHELLWSALYDYIELEAGSWTNLYKNLEIIVERIKKHLRDNEALDI